MKLIKLLFIIITVSCVFAAKNLKIKSNNKETEERSKTSNKAPGFTSMEKDVEAEAVPAGSIISSQQSANVVENPPVPLSTQKDVPPRVPENPADLASTEVTGLDVKGAPPKKIDLQPVTYVKEISAAGKAALDLAESGDIEYQKLLNAGFESPKTISPIVEDKVTRVDRAATQDYLWKPTDPRESKFWSNVEFNKYNNRLLDTRRYSTPAKFEKNMFGNIIVHAPSDSKLMITTPAKSLITTQSSFLSVDEE